MIRNALIPVVTILGPTLAFLVTGSFIIERIFGIPGIGQFYITAIGDARLQPADGDDDAVRVRGRVPQRRGRRAVRIHRSADPVQLGGAPRWRRTRPPSGTRRPAEGGGRARGARRSAGCCKNKLAVVGLVLVILLAVRRHLRADHRAVAVPGPGPAGGLRQRRPAAPAVVARTTSWEPTSSVATCSAGCSTAPGSASRSRSSSRSSSS